MSGSSILNAIRDLAPLVGDDLPDGLEDPRRARQVLHLERVRERRVEAGDARDRRLEREERPLLDERDELRAEPAGPRRLVDHDGAPGLLDGRDDRVDVEGLEGAEVEDL